MLYIVTEDSGSGFQFWTAVKRSILGNSRSAVVISSRGIRNMGNTLSELNIYQGDTLLLAIDMVIDIESNIDKDIGNSSSVKSIIDKASAICNRVGARLLCTKYYCFEEVFISYTWLTDDSNNGVAVGMKKVLREAQTAIRGNVNYAIHPGEHIRNFIELNCTSDMPGREKLSKIMLSSATSRMRGLFRITSGKLGRCWVIGCKELSTGVAAKVHPMVCSKCTSIHKGSEAVEKIGHLGQNSLFAYAGKLMLSDLANYI